MLFQTELDKAVGQLESAKNVGTNFIKDNIGAIGAGAGGIALGSVVGAVTVAKFNSSKTRKKRRTSHKVSKRKNKRKKNRKYARTAGKRKDTSHRRIRMTKNGQPYVIMASGKARFIKKSSAKLSRRRKGGRY